MEHSVAAAIQAMYTAAAAGDFATARRFLSPDFYFFDLGVQYDADEILKVIENGLSQGSVYSWTVTKPRIRFAEDLAWITYTNVGGVTKAGVFTPVTWLESGVLYRSPEGWKIAFMHSTRAPGASEP